MNFITLFTRSLTAITAIVVILVVLFPCTALKGQETQSIWSVDQTTILKDGSPFFAKGMNYSPTPAGAAVFPPGYGDWFVPPWNAIWERDIALMQSMGINAIRTYYTWHWMLSTDLTYLAGITQNSPLSKDQWGNDVVYDHTPFLDACHKAGIYVVFGIALDGGNVFNYDNSTVRTAYQNFYLQTAEKLAEKYGQHPAVMGFCLSNEQNQAPAAGQPPEHGRNRRPETWAYYKSMRDAVKKHAPNKLVTIAFQDDGNLYNGTVKVGDEPIEKAISDVVDVWGLNIYAGMSDDFLNYGKNVIKAGYGRPLWITEWGVPAGVNSGNLPGPPDGSATGRVKTPEEQREAAAAITTSIVSMENSLKFVNGAFYFSYSDEWWKNYLDPDSVESPRDPKDPSRFQTDANGQVTLKDGRKVYPTYVWEQDAGADPDWPEEFWGLYGIAPNQRSASSGPYDVNKNKPFPPDILTPRQLMITALANGYGEIQKTHFTLNSSGSRAAIQSWIDEKNPWTPSSTGYYFGSRNPGESVIMEDFGLVRVLGKDAEGFWVTNGNPDDGIYYFDESAPDFVYRSKTLTWYRLRDDVNVNTFDEGNPTGLHYGWPVRDFGGDILNLLPPKDAQFSAGEVTQPYGP